MNEFTDNTISCQRSDVNLVWLLLLLLVWRLVFLQPLLWSDRKLYTDNKRDVTLHWEYLIDACLHAGIEEIVWNNCKPTHQNKIDVHVGHDNFFYLRLSHLFDDCLRDLLRFVIIRTYNRQRHLKWTDPLNIRWGCSNNNNLTKV